MLKKLGTFLVLLSVSVFFLGCGGKTKTPGTKSPTPTVTPSPGEQAPTPKKTDETPKTTPES